MQVVLCMWGSALYITGADVHVPRWCIGHASSSAMLLGTNCMVCNDYVREEWHIVALQMKVTELIWYLKYNVFMETYFHDGEI